VIVASLVQIRQIEPQIHINVVRLHTLASTIFLQAGTSHDQELIAQAADRVAVAWALERVLSEAIELLGSIVEDLKAGGQRLCIRLLEITTADHEETLRGSLAILEVVLECKVHIDGAFLHTASLEVELNHIFAIFFAHVQGDLQGASGLLNCDWHGLDDGDGLRSILHWSRFTLA